MTHCVLCYHADTSNQIDMFKRERKRERCGSLTSTHSHVMSAPYVQTVTKIIISNFDCRFANEIGGKLIMTPYITGKHFGR